MVHSAEAGLVALRMRMEGKLSHMADRKHDRGGEPLTSIASTHALEDINTRLLLAAKAGQGCQKAHDGVRGPEMLMEV